jgi:hypothetical protein
MIKSDNQINNTSADNLNVSADTNVENDDNVKFKGLKTMSSYAIDPTNINKISSKAGLSTIPVRKPTKTKFFRIIPGEEWEATINVIDLKDGGKDEMYIVDPSLVDDITELVDISSIKRVRLNVGVYVDGGVFLLPTPLPDFDGRWNKWHESLDEMVKLAKTTAIRIIADQDAGGYQYREASSVFEVNMAKIGKKTFWELVSIAFKNREIDTLDHQVIKNLQGM